ncbi:MAG: flavodoxin family protein [Methanoregulaceae archaeon]|nr:flavodoxin family protein [Methanoregulaceae archaeon]
MKVLGICGSPRGEQSRTLRLVNAVMRGAGDAGASYEVVDICGLDIEFCIGCGVCYESGECIHEDDFSFLFDQMIEADGIVFGSPVYINSVTAQMKRVLDRMADAIHCQKFEGKYGCSVSTAGGSFAKEVVEYQNSILRILGATTVGGVDVIPDSDPSALSSAEKKANDLGGFLVNAIRSGIRYPDQDLMHSEMKERMRALVLFKKDIWVHEYAYWKEKGWL